MKSSQHNIYVYLMYAAQTRATAIRDMVGGVDFALYAWNARPAMGHAWRVYDGDPDHGTA